MTSYTIEIGYNSTWSTEQAWIELVGVVERIRSKPDDIIVEAERVESEEAAKFHSRDLERFAASYLAATDLTIKIYDDGRGTRQVRQLASGGGDDRDIKEMLRRAFCRLVIAAMHAKGIEVNLVVG